MKNCHVLSNEIQFIGEGGNKNVDFDTDTLGSVLYFHATTGFSVTHTNCTFQNLKLFYKGGSTPATGSGINFAPGGAFKLQDCAFSGFYNDVSISGGEYWVIDGCLFNNPIAYGLHIISTPSIIDAGDASLSNSVFLACCSTVSNLYCDGLGGVKVVNCKFNTNCGLSAPQSQIDIVVGQGHLFANFLISSCSFEPFRYYGIHMNVTNTTVNSGTINISGNNFTGWNDSVRGCV